MARDLKDRIRGGIDDHASVPDLLLPELIQNLGPGGRLVSDHLPPAALLKLLHELLRKAGLRKGNEGLIGPNTHHLPVSGHRILSVARFIQSAIIGKRLCCGAYAP